MWIHASGNRPWDEERMIQTEALDRLNIHRDQPKLSECERLGDIGCRHTAPTDEGIESTLDDVHQRWGHVDELIGHVRNADPKMRQQDLRTETLSALHNAQTDPLSF